MGRSTIVSELLLFACFVVLAKIPEISTTIAKPLYAKDGFLAGENTPVWIAEPKLPHGATYNRLITRTPFVQWAIQRRQSGVRKIGIFTLRVIRSADDTGNFTSIEHLDPLRDARGDSFYSPSRVDKRTAAGNEVLYPSILVVMSYNIVKRRNRRIGYWLYEELVLYALAFWGSIDHSLRNIQNPRVSLRIAGIVINDMLLSSPYLQWNDGEETFVKALSPMMKHWRSEAKENPDFPIGSYDIVVHMTDMFPEENSKKKAILGVSSQGPPCNLLDKIAGVIVYDDLAFNGLDRTVEQMIKVLGGTEQSPKNSGWPLKSWTREILDPISDALKNASCMSAPKEHHPPGRPVAPIFAGEVMPSKHQCELLTKDKNAWSCWMSPLPNRTTCQSLFCGSVPSSRRGCLQDGIPLDGTSCNDENTKICLDGECIDKIPEISTTIAKPLYTKDGFLAGEDTPVWIAEAKYPNELNYRRIVTVTPFVKWAVKRWKKTGSLPLRVMRSVDDSGNFTSSEDLDALWDVREDSFYSPSPVEKRSTAENEVLYPSILVVMSYTVDQLAHSRISPALYDELVIYALAFWGAIDNSLRNIQNPRISLRIAGIVIAETRESSPYLRWNHDEAAFVSALPAMMDHWRSVAKKNSDFPTGSYDIVVHMTDTLPEGNSKQKAILGVSSQGPPCNLPDKVAGIIVHDDLTFTGLDRTIGQMIKVLGGSEQSSNGYGWALRPRTREIFDPISNALKTASCMSAPKEHHPPGAPVAPILAGEIMSSKQQCEVLAKDQNAWSCWEATLPHKRTTCQSLFCSKVPPSDQRCLNVGFPLDGTFCNDENTKICLAGECVDKIPEISTTIAKPLYAKDGFLAGENTPVWLAQASNPNDVSYHRIITVPPIVQSTIKRWKKKGSFPLRVMRSVDDSGNFTSSEDLDALWDAREDSFYSPSPVEKRSTPENEMRYPSILVVMSYNSAKRPDGRPWDFEEFILYALAFWGTINNSLRNIPVSLSIAGIIICENRVSSSYLQWNHGEESFVKALPPMMDHWKSVAKKNPDFPVGSYDIVVHMTDIFPWLAIGNFSDESSKKKAILAVSSQGPLCNLPDKIAGVIVYDDLAFNGLDRTIGQIIKVLGGNEQSPKGHGSSRVSWTTETLDLVSNALKNASCMSAPKEHNPPGAPIEPILAGEIMPSQQQCESLGYSQKSCWNSGLSTKRTTCQVLYCSKDNYWGAMCSAVGLPLDGTFCNDKNTKICLDGECVDKSDGSVCSHDDDGCIAGIGINEDFAAGRGCRSIEPGLAPEREDFNTVERLHPCKPSPEIEKMQFFSEDYQQLSYQT